jgi:hypothetical protein
MEKIVTYGKYVLKFAFALMVLNLVLDLAGTELTSWVYNPGKKLGLVKTPNP